MITRGIATLVAATVLFGGTWAPAHASEDLTGRWNSDSLRDNRIGYYLELSPVPNTEAGYVGNLRFSYQDGRQGDRVPVRVTTSGNKVMIKARRGSFDKSPGVLRGVLSKQGSTLTLTNCQARLRLVMSNALDSDCVFRPAE